MKFRSSVSFLDIKYIIIAISISFTFTRSQDSECEPIKAILFLDKQILSQKEQLQQALHILKDVVSSFPESSTNAITVIGKEIEHDGLFSLPNDDERLDKIIKSLHDAPEPYASISSDVIERTLTSYFTANQYKSDSEIVFLFMSSLTSIDGKSQTLLNKKAFVIIFGDPVLEEWETISSRDDHLFVVSRTGDLSNIGKRLLNLTCSDSKLYCDTDRFSTKKGAECKDCFGNACPEDPTEESETCDFRCPYYRRPNSDVAVVTNDISEGADRIVDVQDYKSLTLTAILIVLGVVTLPVFAVVIVVYKRQHQQQTSPCPDIEMQSIRRNERDINGGSIDDARQQAPLINESVARQETQAASGGPADCGMSDEEMAASLLKNEAEKEMNDLATGQPPIYDVQTRKM